MVEAAAPIDTESPEWLEYVGRLATDFVFFVEELWKEIGSDRVAPVGEMERDILRWIADSSNNRRGVLAPRSLGKTYFGSAAYTAWRLLRDPNTKVLIVSKSKIPHARDIGRLIRGWLTNVSFLKHLDPADATSEFATDQTFQFDVAGAEDSKTPSVLCQGIEGQITGSRAHLVIADDVETDENTKTVTARAELDTKQNELFNVAKYGDREIVYFGTFHHQESLYLKLAERGFKFRTWPFAYPNPGDKFLGLAPIITQKLADGTGKPGHPVFSHRYSMQHVIENQSQGRTNWLLQYMLVSNLGSSNRYPLRLEDLIVFPVQRDKAPTSIAWGKTNDRAGSTQVDIQIVGRDGDALYGPIMFDPVWADYTDTVGYIDPAGRGRDLAGVAIVGHLASYLFLKCCVGEKGDNSAEGMDRTARLLRLHGVRTCYYEDNADTLGTWGPLMEAALRRQFLEPGQDPVFPRGWKCTLERDHSTGQKELRIVEALDPVLSSHRLVVHPDCLTPKPDTPAHHELQYQIAYLTRDRGCFKEDGKIDALAGAVRKLSESLRIDPKKASASALRRQFEAELAAHNKATLAKFGRSQPPPRWFSNAR